MSARVFRSSSGRSREPRCSALKGGRLCNLEAMSLIRVACRNLRSGAVRFEEYKLSKSNLRRQAGRAGRKRVRRSMVGIVKGWLLTLTLFGWL